MLRINHNVETGEITEVSLTKSETDELEKLAEKVAEKFAERAETEATKAVEKAAVFTKLGLTADEAALLLGGNQ